MLVSAWKGLAELWIFRVAYITKKGPPPRISMSHIHVPDQLTRSGVEAAGTALVQVDDTPPLVGRPHYKILQIGRKIIMPQNKGKVKILLFNSIQIIKMHNTTLT